MRRAVVTCIASLAIFACASSCKSSQSPPAPLDRWNVSNNFLRDPQGRAVIMHGVNLSGAQKNAPYWGFHQQPDFQRVRDEWGMNAIRFIVTWAAIEPAEGQYDSAFLDAVAERVSWAQQANLLVVLDMHDDVYGEGFVSGGGDGAPKWSCDASNYASFTPSTQWYFNVLTPQVTGCYDHFWQTQEMTQHYIGAWTHLVQRLSSFDNVIGFDVINEPYWGSTQVTGFEQAVLEPFYEQVVPAVRAIEPHLIAFLEPSTFRNLGGSTYLTPFSFDDVMYSPHSYDRNAEQGQGFDPADRDPLMANIDALASEAKGLNAGLFIGEYGGMSQDAGIVDYMTAQYDGAGRNAASMMYWSYDESDSYGLLNVDGTEKDQLVGVIMRPYPERVAGTPTSYAYDANSQTFTFVYSPDRSITAPTIVAVPDKLYPNGYQVSCGGCVYTKGPNAVTITTPGTTPGAGDTLTVTVHP